MHVRPFASADLGRVRVLLRQLGYDIETSELAERVNRALAHNDHHVIVAEVDGEIMGLLHMFERLALEKSIEAVVQALVVDNAAKGAGVGRALMSAAEDWARMRGLKTLVLYTNIIREDAQAFYARLGYAEQATSQFLRKAL